MLGLFLSIWTGVVGEEVGEAPPIVVSGGAPSGAISWGGSGAEIVWGTGNYITWG